MGEAPLGGCGAALLRSGAAPSLVETRISDSWEVWNYNQDKVFHLKRKLIGVAIGATAAVGQAFNAAGARTARKPVRPKSVTYV